MCIRDRLPTDTARPDNLLGDRQMLWLVNQELEKLGLRTQRLFWEKILDNVSDVDLARRHKLSPVAMKSRTFRTRKSLRQTLDPLLTV